MIPPPEKVSPPAKSLVSLIWKLATSLIVAIIVIAGLVIALIANHHADNAASEAKAIASCVNSVLGDRAGVTATDNLAHISFAHALNDVLTAPKDKQAAEYQNFLAALKEYVTTLESDQTFRNNHPLGHC